MTKIPESKLERFPIVFGFVAVVFIFLLTLIAIASSWGVQSSQVVQKPSDNKTQGDTGIKPVVHFLTVISPEENFLASSPLLAVTGKTSVGSTVVVITDSESQLADIGPNGNFNLNVNLKEGVTDIEITSFAQNGEEKTINREAFYTSKTL